MNKAIKNIQRGYLAKRRGEGFETFLMKEAYVRRWRVIRIPDGCKQVGANKLIRVRTPFDFVFLKNKKALFVDAKTIKAKSYSFSSLTPHQTNTLRDIYEEGFKSGYIINFTELNKTVFFDGLQINTINRKSSLKPEDGILIGDNKQVDIDAIWQDFKMTHIDESIVK